LKSEKGKVKTGVWGIVSFWDLSETGLTQVYDPASHLTEIFRNYGTSSSKTSDRPDL
jgi:hypothetical protein